jgi:hypothetical protein
MQQQYTKHHAGDLLWSDPDVFPAFQQLKFVRPEVSIGTATPKYNSWSESFAATKLEILKQMPFDVALLGCGSYGLPLTRYIVEDLKRTAIYIGGGLQILFGIKGRRWISHTEIRRLFNQNWVFPLDEETPSGASKVEDSSYWK